MNGSNSSQDLAKRRQELEDVLAPLPISDWQKTAVRAAASGVAKASVVEAMRTFIVTRNSGEETEP